MDIQFYGANCITISNKNFRIVVDDNLADLGAKSVTKPGDIMLFTGPHGNPATGAKILLDHPGEYEVSDVSIYGIPVRGHMEESNGNQATAYKIIIDDIRILVVGHAHPSIPESTLETMGTIDVLFVPVGGNGYTTDPTGALQIIKKIDPRLVIPTHYDDSSLSFPVPQQTLEQAVQTFSMEPIDTTDKFKLKPSDLAEGTHLVIVTRTK